MFLGVLPITLSFTFLAACCHAITPAFVWGFRSDFVSTSLQECQELDIRVTSLNNDSVSYGVPPYYMMAMELNGIPTTEYVGNDRNSLHWVVRHAAGTKLMLGMVDSNRSGGGIAPNLFTVIQGVNGSCLPPPPATNFTVTTNVTTSLTTCQPWGIAISGGDKPYTVTLAALNSPIITNVTLGPTDNFFTFIDRADPNTQLVAAISDVNGTFARGTPLVQTQGSKDVSCTGLVSSGGNATTIHAAADRERARQAHHRLVTIIAIIVTVTVIIVLGGTVACLRIRQLAWAGGVRLGDQDWRPRRFEEFFTPSPSPSPSPSSAPLTISGPLALASFQASTKRSPLGLSAQASPMSPPLPNPPPPPPPPLPDSGVRHDAFCLPDCECRRQTVTFASHYPSRFPLKRQFGVVDNNSSPIPSPGLRRKPQEMQQMRGVPSVGEVRRVGTVGGGAMEVRASDRSLPLPLRTRTLPPIPISVPVSNDGEEGNGTIVIQHRDGGRAVVEIPPPYRSRASGGS